MKIVIDCGRCGKEIESREIGSPGTGIRKNYGVIYFTNQKYVESKRLLCNDCLKDLWDWVYVKGAKKMAEMDKVITHLQIIHTWATVNPDYNMGIDIEDCRKVRDWIDDTLELLKEQPEIVRCMDCKWNLGKPHNPMCQKDGNAHNAYWFCADGERKEGR